MGIQAEPEASTVVDPLVVSTYVMQEVPVEQPAVAVQVAAVLAVAVAWRSLALASVNSLATTPTVAIARRARIFEFIYEE